MTGLSGRHIDAQERISGWVKKRPGQHDLHDLRPETMSRRPGSRASLKPLTKWSSATPSLTCESRPRTFGDALPYDTHLFHVPVRRIRPCLLLELGQGDMGVGGSDSRAALSR